MRLLGFEITRAKSAPAGQPVSDRGWFPIIREPFGGAWQKNLEARAETVLAHSAVYGCATLIASDIAKMRLRLVRQDLSGIWVEGENPAFSPVLRRPNGYQNRIQFFQWWITSKLTHGNTYVLKERDNRGVVIALYILDPMRVRPLVAPDGAVFYQLSGDNLSGLQAAVTVPASEIIHDVMNPLYHPLCGVSPISACGLAAVQGLAIQRNSARFFQNMSRPSGILTSPDAITDIEAGDFAKRWEENYGGENLGKVAIVGGGLKYEAMSVNPDDAQLIEQLKWSGETVCSVFHVPAYKVGVGPPPSFNNVEALDQQYYSQCLQILIECIELCLDEGLGLGVKKEGVRWGTEFDIGDLLRMDTATQVKTLSEAVKGGLIKPNEARLELNRPPVEGGDQVYLQQQNFSLEALAKRDAKEDPFGTAKPEPASAPAADDPANDDLPAEAAEAALGAFLRRDLREALRRSA